MQIGVLVVGQMKVPKIQNSQLESPESSTLTIRSCWLPIAGCEMLLGRTESRANNDVTQCRVEWGLAC